MVGLIGILGVALGQLIAGLSARARAHEEALREDRYRYREDRLKAYADFLVAAEDLFIKGCRHHEERVSHDTSEETAELRGAVTTLANTLYRLRMVAGGRVAMSASEVRRIASEPALTRERLTTQHLGTLVEEFDRAQGNLLQAMRDELHIERGSIIESR